MAGPPQVVYDDATFEDVPQVAVISSIVFKEANRFIFTAGPAPDQTVFRTHKLDQKLEGMLAYQQGRRKRPQRMMIARNAATREVIGCVIWTRQAGKESAVEQSYAQTDDILAERSARHPDGPNPVGFDTGALTSYLERSSIVHQELLGQHERCYISHLSVHPNIQRTGAGRELLRRTRAENADVPIFLEAATTESALPFYEKMGFRCLGYLDFKGAVTPLPCMVLEPEMASLIDNKA